MTTHFQSPSLPANPKSSDWDYFFRQFENYLTIVDAKRLQKLPLLLNSLGRDGLAIYDGLPDPKDTYEGAIDVFQAHFSSKTSILLKRKQFYEARQTARESISDFSCRLRRLSRECDFGENTAILLRDIFVIGVHEDRLGERLLAEDASRLTFEKAVSWAEAYERARSERGAVSSVATVTRSCESPRSASNVNYQGKRQDRIRDRGQRERQPTSTRRCYRCDADSHMADSAICKARNATCANCGKRGHFAKCCRNKNDKFIKCITRDDSNTSLASDDNFDVFHLGVEKPVQSNVADVDGGRRCDLQGPPRAQTDKRETFVGHVDPAPPGPDSPARQVELTRRVRISGHQVTALIDTGAQINVLNGRDLVPDIQVTRTDTKVRAWGNVTLPVLGAAEVEVRYKDRAVTTTFYVVDVSHANSPPLLSYKLS